MEWVYLCYSFMQQSQWFPCRHNFYKHCFFWADCMRTKHQNNVLKKEKKNRRILCHSPPEDSQTPRGIPLVQRPDFYRKIKRLSTKVTFTVHWKVRQRKLLDTDSHIWLEDELSRVRQRICQSCMQLNPRLDQGFPPLSAICRSFLVCFC